MSDPVSKTTMFGSDSPKRLEFNAEEIGFTLKADKETLREIDAIHEEAAQSVKRFAWR